MEKKNKILILTALILLAYAAGIVAMASGVFSIAIILIHGKFYGDAGVVACMLMLYISHSLFNLFANVYVQGKKEYMEAKKHG